MFAKGATTKYALVFLLIIQELQPSSGLLYIVRQTCTRGTIFTPVPSTVSNICLQCVCVIPNISYCKTLIVQLSVVCSAALIATPVTAATTVAPTTTTATAVTVPTIPTIPTPTATTAVGINPRASTPSSSAMMSATQTALVVNRSPMMMMIMAAAGTTAETSMASTPPVPAAG